MSVQGREAWCRHTEVSLALTHSGSGFNQGGKAALFSCNAVSITRPEVCRGSTVVHGGGERERESGKGRKRPSEREIEKASEREREIHVP